MLFLDRPLDVPALEYELYASYAKERGQTVKEFVEDACRYFIRCINVDNACKERKNETN